MNKQPITIEICGIGFPNKGAELMLVAIMQHFSGQNIRWCMAPKNDFQYRSGYQLWQKTEIKRFGLNFAKPLTLLPWKYRRFFGLINESEIDFVFDASGFAYGDQWGLKNSQRLANNIAKWKKQGKKVILFPQALGPFNKEGHKELMTQVCVNADLIFARDPDSLAALTPLASSENLFLCPDFTPPVVTPQSAASLKYKGYTCVIPNNKMLTKGAENEKTHYVEFIASLIKEAQKINDKVLLLSHDGERDKFLLDDIQKRVDSPVPCLYIDSATELKSVISNAKVVVSSRFHGLVSALSNSVPVIATGWSHKYQHLMNDYKLDEFLFKSEQQQEAVKCLNKLLTDPSHYQAITQQLTECGDQHRQQLTKMWQQIEALMDSQKG